MEKENILFMFMKKLFLILILPLLFCLSSCKENKTDENTICGQIYYEIAANKEIIGECSVKVYKAEGLSINLVTAKPTYTTTANKDGYYEFKRMLSDGAWWLVASVNYVDITDIIRERYSCEKVIGLYELSENTKEEINIYLDIQ
jgi:hypothetical protein